MGWKLAAWASDTDLSPNLRAVLVIMCDVCAEDDPTQSFASLSYLAYESGYSVRHVIRILEALEAAKYITCAVRGKGRGNTSQYVIHMKNVPTRPPWREMKRQLIESGELDDGAGVNDVYRAARRIRRQRSAAQGQEQEQEQ